MLGCAFPTNRSAARSFQDRVYHQKLFADLQRELREVCECTTKETQCFDAHTDYCFNATMASEEAVIVVVGCETEYKARVADALAKWRRASETETTKGGVRIFRRESSPDAVVIDTTPLADHFSEWVEAEQWISLNGLRRLFGKLICVICVLPLQVGPEDARHSEFAIQPFKGMHILGHIFAERKRNILILAKLEGTNDRVALRSGVIDALQRDGYVKSNIFFENMGAEDMILTVRTTLERSAFQCKSSNEYSGTTIQFRLKEVTSKCKDRDRYGCWGPERVILLGRTGSGKSTLYQMLTKGGLDPSSKSAASSSIRGETKAVMRGEGRGWYVIDTPGFGELKDKRSTISTEEAQMRIRKYVQYIEGTYSHFIYVVMKDRIDMLDKKLWSFFQVLFEEGHNFTVVVSNATQTWVDRNISALQTDFTGCENFLSGEFPPTATDDGEWEAELEEVRGESLKRLEDELASLSRFGISNDVNDISRRTTQNDMSRSDSFWKVGVVLGAQKIAAGIVRTQERLYDMLKVDEKFVLLPE